MIKIIFFGTPDYIVCIPEALKNAGYEIVAVVTQPAKPVGRSKLITPSPIEVWARQNNVEVLYEPKINTTANLGVVASYGAIIKNNVIESFPQGILNIHPSLLPKYRGASPIQAALFVGDKISGVTIIKMDEKMDHGPIINQEVMKISDSDTTETLRIKAFQKGAGMLIKILPDYLSGKSELIVQNEEKASYTWKIGETKEKAYFDINNLPNLQALDRVSRAFYPWPNAWTKWQGKIVKFFPDQKIQLEGKKIVSLKQFKEGYPDFPLEI